MPERIFFISSDMLLVMSIAEFFHFQNFPYYEATVVMLPVSFRCSSYVGRIGGRQTISVGNADGSIICRHGNIVHEIAHSVGFFHEHSRPDRDDYVNVHWGNVESGWY